MLGFTLGKMDIQDANAEVGGMDRYDLGYDYDFVGAVEDVIENCSVDDDSISC